MTSLAGLAALSISASVARADIPSEQSPAFGKLLDQYATMAGGWFLEQRCNLLDTGAKQELEWNVGETNKALISHMTKPDLLFIIQNSAQKTAAKYPCDQSNKLMHEILELSRQVVYSTTGQHYAPGALPFDGRDIQSLVTAQKIDDACKLIPPDIRSGFDKNVYFLASVFEHANGRPALTTAVTAAIDQVQRHPPACDNRTTGVLQIAVAQAQKLARESKP
jgi:hypothetical protein